MQIISLSQVMEHLPTVANWIYDAFWKDSGQPRTLIHDLLEEHLHGKSIPITFVAIDQDKPVGSVCLIENDLAERPNLTPWLAALYVLPVYRKHGIGSQLVNRLIEHTAEAGFDRVYLTADDHVDLYARLGFEVVETDVGPHELTIMRQTLTI